ncbi:MAG: radical SAM protein, partial [Nitrospinota bacterium]
MRVLLVYPKPDLIEFDTTHTIPLGLAYLGAFLEQAGHQVTALDLNVQPDTLEEQAREHDVVGFYMITATAKATWREAARVKAANPRAYVIVGGPHPTVLPEESLAFSQIDAVARNEAEETMVEFVEAVACGADWGTITGLSYRRPGGEIVHNPARKFNKDLDAYPFPAYHLFPMHKYQPTRPTWIAQVGIRAGSMMTSRGCPYTCNFCTSSRLSPYAKKFRFRSPRNVVDEILYLMDRFQVNFIEFQDDVFNLIPKRSIEICRLMIDEGIQISWSIPNGISRVENVSREFLEVAKASGCIDVWYAAESGSPRIREQIIGKRSSMDDVRNAVSLSRALGFDTGAFFIFGNPDETREDMQMTIDFALSLPIDRAQFSIATPFPGTTYYHLAKTQGRLLVEDWNMYGPFENTVFFEVGATKAVEVLEMYKT